MSPLDPDTQVVICQSPERVACPQGHVNGDLFPGRGREWE